MWAQSEPSRLTAGRDAGWRRAYQQASSALPEARSLVSSAMTAGGTITSPTGSQHLVDGPLTYVVALASLMTATRR